MEGFNKSKKKRNGKNGGVPSRIGIRLYNEVEDIKDKRLRNGKSKERVATEKITNLITRHKLWPEIKQEIIDADEEEVTKYGKE